MLRLKTVLIAAMVAGAAGAPMPAAHAAPLTIHEIQYTTDPAGASGHDGTIVDCAGGIVTHKFGGGKPKITLQDPAFPAGWGAIQVKEVICYSCSSFCSSASQSSTSMVR